VEEFKSTKTLKGWKSSRVQRYEEVGRVEEFEGMKSLKEWKSARV
jgi:hypothetical protein